MMPLSTPEEFRSVFEGPHDRIVPAKRFIDDFDCGEAQLPGPGSKKKSKLRVFWYHHASSSGPSSNSIQRIVKDFLLTCSSRMIRDFVQFWAPMTTEDGRVVLSVLKQPFGIARFSKGYCRYRHYSLDYSINDGRTEAGCDFAHVVRAFTRGSPEFCPNIDVYEDVDFRLKNHVDECGFLGYLALPLFRQWGEHQQSCVGVLEFVSSHNNYFDSVDTKLCLATLKIYGLAFRYPSHSGALAQIQMRIAKFDEVRCILDLADLVREEYSLPLIQVWLPCICKGSEVSIACDPNSSSSAKATHLVCGFQSFDNDEWQATVNFRHDTQVHFIENGESCVGKAHAQKKVCFMKDIRKYSVRNYPRVTSSHSSTGPVLSACFAIPLQLVHPKLPPLVLDVFLPPQHYNDADHGSMLKLHLSKLARELSKYDADFGLKPGEDYCIKFSHSEENIDCAYFDVYRHRDASESVHNMRPQVISHESIGGSCQFTLKRNFPSSGERRSPSRKRKQAHPARLTPEVCIISIESSDECSPGDNAQKSKQTGARLPTSIPVEILAAENRNDEVGRGAPVPSTNGKGKVTVTEVDYGGSISSTNGKGKVIETEHDKVDLGASVPFKNIVPVSVEADESCTLIVKARYEDDIVKFPFSNKSGIEGLRRDLLRRLELEGRRIKIRYEDSGEWILLSCSEDLSFHMRTLKSSGQTTMDLSVFSVT